MSPQTDKKTQKGLIISITEKSGEENVLRVDYLQEIHSPKSGLYSFDPSKYELTPNICNSLVFYDINVATDVCSVLRRVLEKKENDAMVVERHRDRRYHIILLKDVEVETKITQTDDTKVSERLLYNTH